MDKDDIYKQEYLNHAALKERRRLALQDISGRRNEVVFEVNFNSLVKNKGHIKISVGDTTAVVSRDQLWSILFMLGSAEEQERLASPFMKQTKVTKFFKLIGVTTTRNIQKGEMINVPLEFTLNPETNVVTVGKGSMGKIRKMALTPS